MRIVCSFLIVTLYFCSSVQADCGPDYRFVIELQVKKCLSAHEFFDELEKRDAQTYPINQGAIPEELHLADLRKKNTGIIVEGSLKRAVQFRQPFNENETESPGMRSVGGYLSEQGVFSITDTHSCEEVGHRLHLEFKTSCCDVLVYRNFPCGINAATRLLHTSEFDLSWEQAIESKR